MSGTTQKKPVSETDEGDCVYDYFTFNMDELVYDENMGLRMYMPDRNPGELDSGEDSQDSNREDYQANDYPEERSSFDGDEEHPYKDSSEDEEESALKKFNHKQEATKPLKNRLLEKLLKKEVEEISKPFKVPTKFLHEEDDED